MNVTVFGCGPAGLMAVHGAIAGGADSVAIVSRKRKSELFGAQYLHQPIPDTPQQDPVRVEYQLVGEAIDYRQKVYGKTWDGTVSPEDLVEPHNAWDIRSTYDWLWDTYSQYIVDIELTPATIKGLAGKAGALMISTIPRTALCSRGHTFGSADVWAAGDAPSRGISIPYACPPNTILCNGNDSPLWYRLSNVFGHRTVEWPSHGDLKPPVATAAAVRKPTFHNCDCLPEVVCAGRYGRWEKGVLSHTAYITAFEAVASSVVASRS